MDHNLTAKQQRVLDYIKAHLQRSGYPPTVREIAGGLQLAGPNSAKKFLDILERKNFIRRRPGSSRAIELQDKKKTSTARLIPLVGSIRAGEPDLALENIQEHIAVDQWIARGERLFFLRVRGDSMIEAHIADGDLALIRQQPEVEQGDIAAVLLGDEATLKYFYKESGCIRLQPANSAYAPIILDQHEAGAVRIAGKLVSIFRKME